MSLSQYGDSVFLNYKQNYFLWEPAWEGFRPVDAVQWTGTSFQIDDSAYTQDITDPLYGYGSESLKKVCDVLTETYGPSVPSAPVIETPEIGPLTWFRDRHVSLTPCTPIDLPSWKRLVRRGRRTCRRGPRNKFTKRNRKTT